MEQSLVVIRKSPNEKVRTGALLDQKGSGLRVRWHDDGQEEDVRISATTTIASMGSLRYQSFVDPDAIRASWEKDALGLVVRLLRERRAPMNATEIKDQLRIVGLTAQSVDAGWRRTQGKLSRLDDIRVKKAKYSWIGKDDVAEEPSPAVPESHVAAEDEVSPVMPEPEAAEAVASEGSPSAARLVAGAIGMGASADERALRGRPLRVGVGLGKLPSKELERLLGEGTPEDKTFVLTCLLARPHKTPALEAHDPDPAVVTAVLDAAIAEIRGTDEDGLRAAATWLIRRAIGVDRVPAAPIIELARLVAAGAARAELGALDDAVRELGERLLGPMRAGVDPDALAGLVPQLPFRAGRVSLIVAVAELWPQRLTDASWWRDATAEGLAALAHGPMRRVLLRPEVAQRVVAPLMARELASVSSRTRLARLLALPSEFVEHLAAADVAAAFRRAALDDPYASAWLDELAGR